MSALAMDCPWEAMRQGDALARCRLIERYLPFARRQAKSVYRRTANALVDWDDYVQSATEGMLQALERFDPHQGIAFEAYAGQRVRGAVFNQLRVLCDRQGSLTAGSWASRWGERVSIAANADEGGLDAFVSVVVALGIGFLMENDVESAEAADPAYAAESLELTTAVRTGVKKLPEKERLIITLHYMNHVPFQEIAAQMGVTKGRVSQLHHQALGRLRQRLRPYTASGD